MPLKILVVEDHAQFRGLICAALQRRAEFQTVEAADGLEAVQKAEALQPDLVLLDINLPKLHGFEVAKQILAFAPQLPILFLSQESAPEIVRKALSLGGRGYIQKISAATDLIPAIDAALAGHRFVSRSVAFSEPLAVPAGRRHEMLFCSDDAAVIDGLSRYLAAALGAGDAAVVLVAESHRPHLLQELRAHGVDVDGATGRGTFRLFDADVVPDAARLLEAIDHARAAAVRAGKAHPRVAACGERAGRLWAAGRAAEAAQLEQWCNGLAQDVDILCTYPTRHTDDAQTLRRLCAEHTAVFAA